MNWDYRLARRAMKNLKRFPKDEQKRVFASLEEMKSNPFGGDAKLMQGEENLYRRRVGNYRIYFRPIAKQGLLDIPEIERKQSH